MTTKSFPVLTKSATKAEEISWFESVAQSVEPGTYLADFFTKGTVNWVVSQIRNDFPPELYEYYAKAQDDEGKARAEVGKVEAELARSKETVNTREAAYNRLVEQFENFRNTANATEYRLHGEIGKLCSEKSDLETEVEALKAKITSLKADIYDLEHKA